MRWYASLRRSGEIAYVRRAGRHVGRDTLSAFGAPALSGETRICISVSKAVGSAVVRNVVRRRIRGALDALAPAEPPLRIVIVVRPAAAQQPFAVLERDVRSALAKLGPGAASAGSGSRVRAGR